MSLRLNHKAYKILVAEINKAAVKDKYAGEVSQKIALKRLDKLSSITGKPVTEAELKSLIGDLFPDFNPKVIHKAIKVNRPPSKLWLLPKIAIGWGGLAGLVWLLNLPYPMIRRPLAKTAPLILLPSYLRMDRNYRSAIARVEQADQLVNQATSLADINLGQEKVKQAQKHLDALPVWFLGYEPQMYRTFFSFGWKFTFDEFEAARAKVGRMDAKIFQEVNAFEKLEQAQTEIQQAKDNYRKSEDTLSKQQAIAAWQAGIDKLERLPQSTVAKKQADAAYEAYRRDFRQVSGLIAGNQRTNTIIAVAEQFYTQANSSCPELSHSAHRWQQCIKLLERAIASLERVPLEDGGYLEAQTLLANYEAELGEMRIRLQEEEYSQRAYESAQNAIANLPKSVDPYNRDRTAREILTIINQLEKIKPRTTVYQDSLSLMGFAQKKLKQLQ
ncbi:hypothetical protein I4641_04850 [Waterburya agarophytonicola K14]|uniref:Uncharacterized protein n=1 Tax=Waterburya agarophytonicola KI4 TaxID=2874699 RepID=A0A964BNF5_9CYAN|nr:hypothetical protein [Waterburya agarophytonicola]MCC0176304.1 hypothetical protein [Waterburya agarophytonicola KI4]